MKEDLLTDKEIKEVLEEAKNPIYAKLNYLNLGKRKTSIFKLSLKTGLILINGNHSTGLEHIINRHSLMSRIPYWNEEGKIDNPTKFDLDLAPIEYIHVAEKIYKPENLNNDKNKRKEIFDTYICNLKLKNSPALEFTLVTYKNTGIVHTLFISSNKKPFNKKKVLNLRQGWVSSSYEGMSCIETYEMSYFDIDNIERYKVILKSDIVNGIDKWYVQVNSKDGAPKLTTLIKQEERGNQPPFQFRMTQIDFSNITWIEQIIKKIMQGEYEF